MRSAPECGGPATGHSGSHHELSTAPAACPPTGGTVNAIRRHATRHAGSGPHAHSGATRRPPSAATHSPWSPCTRTPASIGSPRAASAVGSTRRVSRSSRSRTASVVHPAWAAARMKSQGASILHATPSAPPATYDAEGAPPAMRSARNALRGDPALTPPARLLVHQVLEVGLDRGPRPRRQGRCRPPHALIGRHAQA